VLPESVNCARLQTARVHVHRSQRPFPNTAAATTAATTMPCVRADIGVGRRRMAPRQREQQLVDGT
jgi:hypothetical protein